jgi:putative NADH-flavin reductase
VSRITVIGGTGYAGSAIVAEAAARGHQVTALSRSLPGAPIPDVTYVQGDASAGAALIIEDLPAAPATLDWVFVSPALRFGARMPGERLGHYRLGDDVAVQPEDGGAISAADYALGFVDLIEKGDHHRAQVNLAH